MNKPSLKNMIENECANNERFKNGRKLVIALVCIYLAVRFSDLIIPTLISGVPFEIDFGVVASLLFALLIGFLGIIGSVKATAVLCLLTPVVNMLMLFSVAREFPGGFAGMLRLAPAAWYVLIVSAVCTVIGFVLLLNGKVRYFGKRRIELQKEYAALVRAYGAGLDEEDAVAEWEEVPQENVSGMCGCAAHQAQKDNCIEAVNQRDVANQAYDKKEAGEAGTKGEKNISSQRVTESNVDATEDIIENKTEAASTMKVCSCNKLSELDEFEGERSPLRAYSIPSAISKVNKKRVFDLQRDLVCKKYKCTDIEINPETHVLIFAGNKKTLIKWIPEEKRIYLESSTNNFDEDFHDLMFDVISYLGKNMGAKFEIMDSFKA